MFTYKGNGIFRKQNVSIKFPENYDIGMNFDDWENDSGLFAFNQEQHYCIHWRVEADRNGTEKDLQEILDDDYKIISPIEPFIKNGFNGHQALYTSESGRSQYFERRYNLKNGKQLLFLIESHTNIKDILNKPEIQNLLDSIKID